MSFRSSSAIALMGILGVASTASAAVIYDSNGFESPTFTVGPVAGQNGWTYYSESSSTDKAQDVVIQDAIAHNGSQALLVKATGARTLARKQYVMTANHFVDVWLRPPSDAADYYRNVTVHMRGRHVDPADSTVKSGLQESIQLNSAGVISGFSDASFTLGQWNRFTIYNDVTNNEWSLYINGQLAIEDQPYNNADVVEINQWDFDWTSAQNPTGSSLYVDDFRILDTNPIPEPAGTVLLAAGVATMMRRRRRRVEC